MQIYHGTEQTLEADTFLSLLQSDYESVFLTDCIIEGAIVFSPESEVDVEGKFAVDKEIVCIRCTFKNLIKFENTFFQKRGVFRKFCFPRCRSSPKENVFQSACDFGESVFEGSVLFRGTIFHGMARFQKRIFSRSQISMRPDSQKMGIFRNAIFQDTVHFKNAFFSNELDFVQAQFSETVIFNEATFLGKQISLLHGSLLRYLIVR